MLFKPMVTAESSQEASHVAPEIIAVVAAAIENVIDTPFRITTISERNADGTLVSLWSVEGRRAIFSSHKLR
jgi:hypothetical protein